MLLLLETLRRLCVREGRPLLLCHHFFVVLLLLLLRDGLIVFLDESLGVLFLTKKLIAARLATCRILKETRYC